MASEGQSFSLRWNNFSSIYTSEFETLRNEENFIDVTIVCSGKLIKAHKLVLSACSQYFKHILKDNPCEHPVIILQEINYNHMRSLIDFMYLGEVNIMEDELTKFLQMADNFQVRGLNDLPLSKVDGNEPNRDGFTNFDVIRNHKLNNASFSINRCEREYEQSSFNVNSEFRTEFSAQSNEDYQQNNDDTNNPITADSMQIEYSSDEDIKPDTSLSLIGMATPDPLAGDYSSLEDKSEVKETKPVMREHNGRYNENNQSQLGAQSSQHHSLDPRPCPSCGRIYSNTSNLRQHIRLIHKPECIACPLCAKLFKNKLYLKRHLVSFHELPPPEKIKHPKTTCSNFSTFNYTTTSSDISGNLLTNFMSNSIMKSTSDYKHPQPLPIHNDFPMLHSTIPKSSDTDHNALNSSVYNRYNSFMPSQHISKIIDKNRSLSSMSANNEKSDVFISNISNFCDQNCSIPNSPTSSNSSHEVSNFAEHNRNSINTQLSDKEQNHRISTIGKDRYDSTYFSDIPPIQNANSLVPVTGAVCPSPEKLDHVL